MTTATANAVALRIERLSKTFPGTRALRDVSLEVSHGKTLALLGHNGSGKSTLIKVLAGFHQPDAGGAAWVDGDRFELGSSEAAKRHGLRFVHQDLGLIRELNAVDNIALSIGYSRTRSGQVHQAQQKTRTEALLGRFGVHLDVSRPLGSASPVERTSVAIARALWDWEEGRRILVLDEPTAALPAREVSQLFEVVKEVQAAGHAVIYVSHRMEEIFEVADSMTVLRAGRVVGSGPVREQSPESLASLIAGHDMAGASPAPAAAKETDGSAAALEVGGLSGRYLRGIDLRVEKGEVVGVAGLLGSGRDELPYALSGAVPTTAEGGWRISGREVADPDISSAESLGIAFVPPERAREGLIPNFSVGENLTLGALPGLKSAGYLSRRRERTAAKQWLAEIGLPADTLDRDVSTLSGGNQQRVLLARCLYTQPSLLVLSEPTAGVDVAARQGLYDLLEERCRQGLSIVLCSSDTEDLTTACNRVLVLRGGRIVDEMSGPEIEAPRIVASMEGGQ